MQDDNGLSGFLCFHQVLHSKMKSEGSYLLESPNKTVAWAWNLFWLYQHSVSKFKQQRVKQISLALHHQHCRFIWLTDEHKIISNSFSASKQMKHHLGLNWMGSVVPGPLCFSTFACNTWRSSHTRLNIGQLSAVRRDGGAELHLQEDNRVPLSQAVYTLFATKSGHVEGGPALKQARLCESLRVCTYGCRGSNLGCAGGYSLFDMIDSPCSLQRAETTATFSAVCLSKSGGGVHPLGSLQSFSILSL